MTHEYHSDRILDWLSWLERMSQITMQSSTRPRRTLLNPSPGRTRPGFSLSASTKSRGTVDCLLLAQSGDAGMSALCPLLGVKRTSFAHGSKRCIALIALGEEPPPRLHYPSCLFACSSLS